MNPEQREIESRIKAASLALAWEEGYRDALKDQLSEVCGQQIETQNPYRESQEVAA